MDFHGMRGKPEKKPATEHQEARDQLSLPFFKVKGQPNWDRTPRRIVVIGSGIGGMASGALFARIGHTVNVLEMNRELIGGHGRCLTFQGMSYSMGPQYVWEFGEGMLGDRFMRFLGIHEENPFLPMRHDSFERIFVGGKRDDGNFLAVNFRVPMGLGNFRRDLKALFPEESDHLDELFDEMIAVYDIYRTFFRKHSVTEGRLLLATKFLTTSRIPMSMKVKIGRCLRMSVKELFDHFHISSLPRRILYGHGGIFAENESEMSAIAYIVGTGNYHLGAWYPQNGFSCFFDSLASVIQDSGGSVETGKRVIRLETEGNTVTGVACEDGSHYECDFVFSDISPRLTYALMGRKTEVFGYTPSHCIPACCLGIEGGLQSIAGMKGRNYWWQDGDEVDYVNPDITAPPRMLFIGSPTANGYGRAMENGNDALVVFCPGNYQREKAIYEEGPGAVERYKKGLAADIVDILDRNVFPGIRSRILFAEVVSSMDIERDTAGELGNAYGRRLTVKEVMKGSIDEEDRPQNLYNVSATKNSPGIAAGIYTAELILKELTGIELL